MLRGCISLLRPIKTTSRFISTSPMSNKTRINGDQAFACFPEQYSTLLDEKVQTLRSLLSQSIDCKDIPIEVFESPRSHFRMRANFNVWWENPKEKTDPSKMYYAMFDETDKKFPKEITTFPRGSTTINRLMQFLMTELRSGPAVLYEQLFEVRFITSTLGQAAISLIYHKKLSPEWTAQATLLSERLSQMNDEALRAEDPSPSTSTSSPSPSLPPLSVRIVGRAHKEKQVVGGPEEVREEVQVRDRTCVYYHIEGAFSQPNAFVCRHMLEWAVEVGVKGEEGGEEGGEGEEMERRKKRGDLLELYCGGGTFTAALSPYYEKVLATEMSRSSVGLALPCFRDSRVGNVKIARLTAEEVSEAFVHAGIVLEGEEEEEEEGEEGKEGEGRKKGKGGVVVGVVVGGKEFTRLREAGIKLSDYSLSTVLVDPPRAGLDSATCSLLSRFPRIIYISCNPQTLSRDLLSLSRTHNLVRSAAFDQFPYTHHLEAGVFLVKKSREERERVERMRGGGGEEGEEMKEKEREKREREEGRPSEKTDGEEEGEAEKRKKDD